MAGLLDYLSQDPNEQRALVQGLLSGAFGAMAGRGSKLQAWGQGGLAGLSGYGNELERQATEKTRNQQLQRGLLQDQLLQGQITEQQRQQAQAKAQQDWLNSLQSPQQMAVGQALAGGGGPTVANAAKMPAVDPAQQLMFDAVKTGALPVQNYITSMQKDNSPIAVKEGEALLDRKTFKPIFTNPKDDSPSALKEYRFAVSQGYPGSFDQWNKETKRAGAASVSVNTAQNPFFSGLGGFGAKQFEASATAAQEAAKRIEQNAQISDLLKRGNLYTGSGAEAKLAIGKALQSAGIKLDPDALRNTELLGSQLAQRTLNSIRASGLGAGQGFTDKDREFLASAVGGSIALEGASLRRLIELDNKAAQATIRKHNKMAAPVQKSAAMNGFPMDFSVPEPEVGSVVDFGSLK